MNHDFHWKIWPPLTFLAVMAVGYGARQAIGTVYGAAEAVQLLEALSRAGLYLGSAVATASATTLALMLTLIGMMRRADTDFDDITYRRVMLIAGLATAALMSSLVVLLAFVFPMGEFDALPGGWYQTLYDVLFAACVLMVALLATTVTVTYMTVRHVIAHITPGEAV
jgi:ABC-type multidrug transport system permease subunit